MKGEKEEQLELLVDSILRSPKYGNVCEDVITNIGRSELSKRRNLKIAIKATKNKLHQVGGAYFLKKPNYSLWLEKLKAAKKSEDKELVHRVCAEIMNQHHSTRERLNILDDFYARIFSLLPPVSSIMDVACGFHPLSIPWMPILNKTKYYAFDIYRDMMRFLSEFMAMNKIQGHAEARDVIQHPPESNVDLAFLLNTIPCLEQIEKSAGLKILEALTANFIAVSFPVRTLGGREKDMRRHYETAFNKLVEKKDWSIQHLEFSSELVFLIKK